MAPIKVGIIGGTGMDDPDIMEDRAEKSVNTPFGPPSDVLITGRIKGVDCVLLARHGRKHHLNPTNVNYRANIHALKAEGCTHLLVTSACGSLQEEYAPGQLAFLDQFIDRTTKREQTFHDGKHEGYQSVSHIPMVQPFCEHTRQILMDSAKELDISHHKSGTMVVIEGPRFSTKAESNLFRSWGAHTIGMTLVPEVVLAREAGLCYATAALVTDYDCWREEGHVTVEAVMQVMRGNAEKAKKLFLHAIPKLAAKDWTDIFAARQAEAKGSVMH